MGKIVITPSEGAVFLVDVGCFEAFEISRGHIFRARRSVNYHASRPAEHESGVISRHTRAYTEVVYRFRRAWARMRSKAALRSADCRRSARCHSRAAATARR